MHIEVGQLLYATKLNLDQLAKQVPKELIAAMDKLLSEAIQQTRKVTHELVPIVLKDFGLTKAMQELCRSYHLRINCEIKLEDQLEPHLELALYRINQEFLNNVVKHAQTTEADVLLMQDNGAVTLKVRDNGIGLPAESGKKKSIGLRTIADRIKLLNGTFSITKPFSGKGTQITISLPT